MESIADSLNTEKEKVCVTSKLLLLLFELYACENLPSKLMTWFSIIDLNDIDDVFLSFSVFLPRRLLLHYILESDWEKPNQQTHLPQFSIYSQNNLPFLPWPKEHVVVEYYYISIINSFDFTDKRIVEMESSMKPFNQWLSMSIFFPIRL